jgi:hypothetical protein
MEALKSYSYDQRDIAEQHADHVGGWVDHVADRWVVMADGAWEVGPVCIDDYLTVLAQYDPRIRWNGWLAAPRFDAWAVEFVLALMEDPTVTDAEERHEWNADGSLTLVTDNGDGPWTDRIEPDEDGLYALGAYGWVWSEDSQPDETNNDGRPSL